MGGLSEGSMSGEVFSAPPPSDRSPETCLALPELKRRLDDAVLACERSDLYDYASLACTVWFGNPDRAYEEIPPESAVAVADIVDEHPQIKGPSHQPWLREVSKPEDQEQFKDLQRTADLIVHILREDLGVGTEVSEDDFQFYASSYNLLPEETAEQQRLARILASRPGMGFSTAGRLCIAEVPSHRWRRLGSRISVMGLLDKLEPQIEVEKPKVVRRRSERRTQTVVLPLPEPAAASPASTPADMPHQKSLFRYSDDPVIIRQEVAKLFAEVADQYIAAFCDELPVAALTNYTEVIRYVAQARGQKPDSIETSRQLLPALMEDPRFIRFEDSSILLVIKPEAPKDALHKLYETIMVERERANELVQRARYTENPTNSGRKWRTHERLEASYHELYPEGSWWIARQFLVEAKGVVRSQIGKWPGLPVKHFKKAPSPNEEPVPDSVSENRFKQLLRVCKSPWRRA